MSPRTFWLILRRRDGAPVPAAWHRQVGALVLRHPDVVAFRVDGALGPDGFRYAVTLYGEATRTALPQLGRAVAAALPGAICAVRPANASPRPPAAARP